MNETVTKSELSYKVYAVRPGYNPLTVGTWYDNQPQYTGITYTEKKDAIKALEYYGKGYVEASRYVKTERFYDGTYYSREDKKIYELN